MHLSTHYDFKNTIFQEISLLFCNISPINLMFVDPCIIVQFIKKKEKSNKMKQWIKILLFHIYMKLSMSQLSLMCSFDWFIYHRVVRLKIFKLSVPVSEMWQPKHAFDIHLCYLVVINVKIFLTQNRIALWISFGSCFSKQTCNFTAIYSLNGMEIDCCAICFLPYK